MAADRHKRNPLTVRLSEAAWTRLKDFAVRVGKSERVVVREAVTEYLDSHEHDRAKHDPQTPKES